MTISYKGVDSPASLRVLKVTRSILPPSVLKTMEIDGKAGAYFISKKHGAKKIEVEVAIIGTNDIDMRNQVRAVAQWLDADKPEALILDDEPTLTDYAILEDETDLDEILQLGTGTITFLCPNPFSEGANTIVTLSDSQEITPDGNHETYPKIHVAFMSASTNCTIEKFGMKLLPRFTFAGKYAGSIVENPNLYRYRFATTTSLPSAITTEATQASYDNIKTINSVTSSMNNATNGNLSQVLFSIDMIAEVEKRYGVIPASDVAGKVAWLKENVSKINLDWQGRASSSKGYKAFFTRYNAQTNTWQDTSVFHTNSTYTKISHGISATGALTPAMAIDVNGFVHCSAYSETTATLAVPSAPTVTASGTGSTLPAGTYFVTYTWVNSNGATTKSAESSVTTIAGQNVVVTIPALPFGATRADIYIGTTTGTGTLQGNTTTTSYTKSNALVAGSAFPASNTAVVSASVETEFVEFEIEMKEEAQKIVLTNSFVSGSNLIIDNEAGKILLNGENRPELMSLDNDFISITGGKRTQFIVTPAGKSAKKLEYKPKWK